MADVKVVLNLLETEIPDIMAGLLEIYPNTSAEEGNPIPDDMWLMKLPGIILGDLVRDGLKRKAMRIANQQIQAAVTPSIQVELPDGTIIS